MKRQITLSFLLVGLFIVFLYSGISKNSKSTENIEMIEMKEMGRIAIELFPFWEEDLQVKGHLMVNGIERKLPIGSTLDQKKGQFFWTPGPGFLGEYSLKFHSELLNKDKEIRVVINPKFPGNSNSRDERELSWLQVTSNNPFGDFSTPIDQSTVRSSIAVTGWALDDSGIENVKIYIGDTNNLIFIGDAMLVEGARPDIADAYPDYPGNTKAGWGYMLLTNFLPGGDGNFELHAIANAKDGGQKSLGTKTIYVDNAHAVKPFGAIDTPAQGGTASGNNFSNWGWVLTPQPNHIPTDGSTISVYVDGVFVGHPTYNIYRPDVAALFPGYANSSGSGGHFYLDTTAYENGVHSIFWTTTDSGGNSDGIGSRFFIITGNNSYSYTLNVTKGAGVSGTPDSGTTSYTVGTTVNYSYSLLPGYTNLVVKLDGNTVANSGTVTMNQNHTLTATATQSGVPTVEWIKIPAGEFKMGDNFNEGNSDERPVHTVYLSEYEISKYEVTFDQYDAFCDDTGRTKPADKGWGRGSRPVIEVSWDDAKAFCDWMSSKTGQDIHLPTEAQWEKAARGTDQRRYPWGNNNPTSSLCNFNNNVGKTQPVGSFPSGVSPYGVHDMAGNVWEWCQDWYGYSYYSSSPYSNPTGPSSGTYRVPRGGSWRDGAWDCRVAIRNWNGPAAQVSYLGFRLARGQSGVPTVEWIKIPAGEFKMGDNFNEGYSDELPVHTVYLSEYDISKYEVTFNQYDAFCEDTGRTKPSDEGWGRGSRPVINVSRTLAETFCDWLSSKTGQDIHLPTEAQWEKAARGTDQRRYPWGNDAPTSNLCNFDWNVGKTQPVGSYPSGVSPYGVHDMAGNVLEMCQDEYGSSYYSSSPYSNPTGPSSGGLYSVNRGGGWNDWAGFCRVAYRWPSTVLNLPYSMSNGLGFRLARSTQVVPSDPVVHLKSTPTGAKVYADSQEIGSSTPADFTLSSGQHEIRLVLENYGKAKKTMNFEKGKTYNINVTLASYTYEFVLKWSRYGIGLEEFLVIEDIAVDKNGYVYVADYEYDIVHKFDSYGNLITQWWLGEPHSIAVDTNGYVYASNDYSYIYKYNSMGGYITRWGGEGSGISIITGIAIDNVGYIYAADYYNKILVYTPNGEFVKQWGSQGNGNGQFENPYGIAIDTQNYVYVSDYYNHRIQKFTSNGGFVSQWGSHGSNNSQFSYPQGISVDRNNYIYVCDTGNNRIQKFTSDGNYVTKWGSGGSGDGQLGMPIGIAVDNNDYVYVTEESNHRIQKFRISSTETDGDGDWQINTSPKASTTITSMYEKERQDNKKVQSSNKEEKKKTIIE